jgi:hypothetical protein
MPGTPRDVRRKHEAVAYVAANEKPTRFYGGCGAGDFRNTSYRATEQEARADVAKHLVEVSRQPHLTFVSMVPEWPHGYLGFCAAGDFSPGLVRASRAEAEAEVAPHLLEIGRGLIVRDELPEGVTDAQPADRLNTHGGFGVPVQPRTTGGAAMSATHFVLWTSGERTHIASRNAYRRGEASCGPRQPRT